MLPNSGQIYFSHSNQPKKVDSAKKTQIRLKQEHKIADSVFHDFIQNIQDKSGNSRIDEIINQPDMQGGKDDIPAADKPDLEVRIQQDTNQEKLDKLTEKSDPLIRIKTHLPINLEPKEIIVDISKVTIITKQLLGAKQVVSIAIEDITDVIIDTIPFFATMKIFDKGFAQNSVVIRFLKKSEAIETRKIIEGLVAARKARIDLFKVDRETVYQKLAEIGSAADKV